MPLFRNVKRHAESAPDPTRKINQPGPSWRKARTVQAQASAQRKNIDTGSKEGSLESPAVGWLVVIAGPGCGRVLTLGYGINDIGRGSEARVRLDFGDNALNLGHCAAILYSAKTRHFYLQVCEGVQVALDGSLIRGTTELKQGQILVLGQTQLRFVPLCGPDFDWSSDTQAGYSL